MAKNNPVSKIAAVLKENGFQRRGSAFFRVQGDVVLLVLKYVQREAPWHREWLKIGAFSLYGEILPQWLTPGGCIPTYMYHYLKIPKWEAIRLLDHNPVSVSEILNQYDAVFHMDCLTDVVLPFLNQITDQKTLLSGIMRLDYVSWNKEPAFPEELILWTDMQKFAPLLWLGEIDRAAMVIDAFLKTYDLTKDHSNNPRYQDLLTKKTMLERDDPEEIRAWLASNYEKNRKLLEQSFRFTIR